MMRIFGPGAIIASVTIGSGRDGIRFARGGRFWLCLLWCFVGSGLMKFVQVYTAARYMTLTGEHPIGSWAYCLDRRGGRRLSYHDGSVFFPFGYLVCLKCWEVSSYGSLEQKDRLFGGMIGCGAPPLPCWRLP